MVKNPTVLASFAVLLAEVAAWRRSPASAGRRPADLDLESTL